MTFAKVARKPGKSRDFQRPVTLLGVEPKIPKATAEGNFPGMQILKLPKVWVQDSGVLQRTESDCKVVNNLKVTRPGKPVGYVAKTGLRVSAAAGSLSHFLHILVRVAGSFTYGTLLLKGKCG